MTLCSKLVMMSHLHLSHHPSAWWHVHTCPPWHKAGVSHNCGVTWVVCREWRLFRCLSKITSATKLLSLLPWQILDKTASSSRKALAS